MCALDTIVVKEIKQSSATLPSALEKRNFVNFLVLK